MPGIFGFISSRPVSEGKEILRRMAALLAPTRAPRARAVFGGNWGIGAAWTSGLQADPEPRRDPETGWWFAASGEIYGAPGGLESPGRVLLDALGRGKPEDLAEVNGAFSGVLYNPSRGTLSAVTDRCGLQLLYYAWTGGVFAFASEMKALLAIPGAARRLDPSGLAAFLLLGEQIDDATLLEGVKAAPAGALLESDGGPPAVKSLWRFRFTSELEGTSPGEAAREAGRLFKQGVERQVRDGRPLGIPLSGGLDSRLCLAALPEKTRRVSTFTWGEPGCLDRRIAAGLAARFGAEHHDYDYRYEDLAELGPLGVWWADGQAGCSDYHFLPYLGELEKEAEVVLNGFAGDVILGGNFHKRAILGLPLEEAGRTLFRKKNDGLPAEIAAKVLLGGAAQAARGLEDEYVRLLKKYDQGDPLGTVDAFLLDTRVRRWTSFGTQMLRTRLVSRSPFYDNDFLDFLTRVPPSWRTRHRFYRRVLLLHFKEAASLPWETTGFPASWPPGIFRPVGAATRAALGRLERLTGGRFKSPYPVARIASAYRGVLAPLFEKTILDKAGPVREIVRGDFIERIWRETLAGRDSWAKTLGILLALHWFHELFLGEPPPSPMAGGDVKVLDGEREGIEP